jgi:DNA-binding transcriptional LysR family regulator
VELKWLEDFVALAHTGSFSRAAQDRNVTQPAFSRRIRALEDWLGVPLVDRSVYPTTLTTYGEEFLPRASEIIANATGVRQDFRSAAQASRRQVKIVTLHTLAIHVVPDLVSEFLASETACSVDIVPSIQGIEAYFDALETGSAHIVVAYAKQLASLTGRHLVAKTVSRGSFIPVVARSYLESRGPVNFNETRKVPVVAYTPFNFSHTIVEPVFKDLENKITIRGESTLGETLKALVQHGVGVGWLPSYSIQRELASGELVPLPDEGLEIPFEICAWRREKLQHQTALRLFESWSLATTIMPNQHEPSD